MNISTTHKTNRQLSTYQAPILPGPRASQDDDLELPTETDSFEFSRVDKGYDITSPLIGAGAGLVGSFLGMGVIGAIGFGPVGLQTGLYFPSYLAAGAAIGGAAAGLAEAGLEGHDVGAFPFLSVGAIAGGVAGFALLASKFM